MREGKATHKLKLDTKFFDDVKNGVKTFEIRKNDRDFRVLDTLVLYRYDPINNTYLKKSLEEFISVNESEADHVEVSVVYITDYAQKDNYIVMGIS